MTASEITGSLKDVSTYKAFVETIQKFSKNITRQSAELDQMVDDYRLPAQEKDRILAESIESFVHALFKTRVSMAKQHPDFKKLTAEQERIVMMGLEKLL